MTAAYGIHSHLLQLRQLAVEGIFIEGSAKASKVVVLADTVELEVAPIEPEACLGIKAERAETCCRRNGINYLASHQDFRQHIVYIWLFTRP